jgi:hypothetical protein
MRSVVPLVLAPLALTACRAIVEPGITYVGEDAGGGACQREIALEESFSTPTDMSTLSERCWQVDNLRDAANGFVDDGDFVLRVSAPTTDDRDEWSGEQQAPMLYQALAGDFLVVTRVEGVKRGSGSHCLPEGNAVGLAARRPEPALEWTTLLIAPFTPDPLPEGSGCEEEAEVPLPTKAIIRSRDEAWGPDTVTTGDGQEGIGVDGEADLALCRVDTKLIYFYREPTSDPETPVWTEILEHDVGTGPLDVGLTATGMDPDYEAEGHFTWAAVRDGLPGDGCTGAFEDLEVPKEE